MKQLSRRTILTYLSLAAAAVVGGQWSWDTRSGRVGFWNTWAGEIPELPTPPATPLPRSNFHTVYDVSAAREQFLLFLEHIYHLYPEHKFHALITSLTQKYRTDEEIYGH